MHRGTGQRCCCTASCARCPPAQTQQPQHSHRPARHALWHLLPAPGPAQLVTRRGLQVLQIVHRGGGRPIHAEQVAPPQPVEHGSGVPHACAARRRGARRRGARCGCGAGGGRRRQRSGSLQVSAVAGGAHDHCWPTRTEPIARGSLCLRKHGPQAIPLLLSPHRGSKLSVRWQMMPGSPWRGSAATTPGAASARALAEGCCAPLQRTLVAQAGLHRPHGRPHLSNRGSSAGAALPAAPPPVHAAALHACNWPAAQRP